MFTIHYDIETAFLFVIDNMWLQCKRSNKIHVLLYVTNFHVPIIVSFNHWATHQPHREDQALEMDRKVGENSFGLLGKRGSLQN
jgi:hypothetical protein